MREQLDSFLALKNFSDCCVLVRDDGSTDGTREILLEYTKLESFEVVFGTNLGITQSYFWLLQHSNPQCEYFAFSDQDDVWLPDKLSKAVASLSAYPEETAALFGSQSYIMDANLQPIGKTFFPIRGVGFYNALIQNVLPGHTQVFNRVLREYLINFDFGKAECIDWWTYLLASALGVVVFEPSCTVLHRQHENNAVGYQLHVFGNVVKRLLYIHDGKGNKISRQIYAFYQNFRDRMPEEYRTEVERYLSGLTNVWSRLQYLKCCRVYRQQQSDDWKFRVLYLLGKYNLPTNED